MAGPTIDPGIHPEFVLFDLGGVIIDLSGLDRFLARHELEPATFWPRWLGLGAGRDFERGLTSPEEFARAFLDEFALALSPDRFLEEFAAWPSGLLPGAADLVREVPLPTAALSNTNALHWETELQSCTAGGMFDHHFLSFELGLTKPSPEIFTCVTAMLGCEPGQICFIDDNEVNVEAALAAGWNAALGRGPANARAALVRLGVLH